MPKVTRQGPGSSPRGNELEIVEVTGNMTVTANHCECVLQVNSGSDVTITLPRHLPAGFTFMVEQYGAGAVIFAAAAGATMANRQDFDRTAGQDAVMAAYVRNNPNHLAAEWLLTGDGAAA
jgi:hypothetical protein